MRLFAQIIWYFVIMFELAVDDPLLKRHIDFGENTKSKKPNTAIL